MPTMKMYNAVSHDGRRYGCELFSVTIVNLLQLTLVFLSVVLKGMSPVLPAKFHGI